MKRVIKVIVGLILGIIGFFGILLLCLLLLFSPKVASREELISYQMMLEQGMESYGFTGKVELTKFRPITIGNPWDVLEYDYTEVIDGQSITLQSSDTLVNNRIEGQEALNGLLNMTVYFNDSPSGMLYQFDGIVDQAMWHQPRGKYLLNQAQQIFKLMEEKDFTLFEVDGRLETQDEKLIKFYKKVEGNRYNGRAFAGFYDINLDWLMEEEMAVIEVEFFNKKDLGLENGLLEKDKLLADLKQKVETFDYSNVEDGTYRIGFRRPGVQSTSFFVTIKVKDHHHSFLK
ncbi:hypothetical protein [Streptococcus suis]|uniref:hypothetical protein n=1 Tax=Streptococcus suis TaxID=1307 RepID=UPI0023D845F4|nr:hypothetical protein M8286_03005 [Streptococcus suis]